MTGAELLAKLDAACLGRTPEQSLRRVSNGGRGFWKRCRSLGEGDGDAYISTHVDADLAGLADVIEAARAELGGERCRS